MVSKSEVTMARSKGSKLVTVSDGFSADIRKFSLPRTESDGNFSKKWRKRTNTKFQFFGANGHGWKIRYLKQFAIKKEIFLANLLFDSIKKSSENVFILCFEPQNRTNEPDYVGITFSKTEKSFEVMCCRRSTNREVLAKKSGSNTDIKSIPVLCCSLPC